MRTKGDYFMRGILVLVPGLGLSACVHTRDPNPVNMKQRGDEELTCRDIETEYGTNTEVATNKISKNNADDGRDILLGFFIWPGLADFKNAEESWQRKRVAISATGPPTQLAMSSNQWCF